MNYKIGYVIVSLFMLVSAYAQQNKVITGVILDQDKLPLIGATVMIEGTLEGTSTDLDGNFSLQVKEGDKLEISYVFYETKRITVDTKSHYYIELVSEGQVLDDIVVVAYGTSSKEAVTGAVSMIHSEDIAKRPGASVLSALEGAAPGVRVNNTSGQPGAEVDVQIRGFTSLVKGGNQPLIMVDGVAFSGSISDLNSDDIDSISVLKDASSTTLYGNRASNGVILITTKKGSKGKSKFNAKIKQGLVKIGGSDYETIGADDFMNVMWKGYRNSLVTRGHDLDKANAYASEKLISNVLYLNIYDVEDNNLFVDGKLNPLAKVKEGYINDRDWVKPLERTGYYQDINLSGSVNNEKGGAFISGGIFNNKGYFKKADFKRFTGRVNADYQVNNWMKIGGNMFGSYSEGSNVAASPTSDSGSAMNPFNFGRTMAPIYPVHLHDPLTGDFIYDDLGQKIYDKGEESRNQYRGRHVVWENELNSNKSIRNVVNGNFFTDIDLVDNLVLTLRGNLSISNDENRNYNNAIIGDGRTSEGRVRMNNYRTKSFTTQQLLTWKKELYNHSLEALIGHESYSSESTQLYARKTHEIFEGNDNLNNFTNVSDVYDFGKTYRTEGYLSRLKYDYNNKYFIEGSFRRDGSSKFHKDNRWGNFWSVGGGWIVSNESFLESKYLNYLKLRLSYGQVGNDKVAGMYAAHNIFNIRRNGGEAAAYQSQIGNENLKWETSSSVNLGIDGVVFKRVNYTIEYFDKRSQNLLFDLNRPLSVGATNTGRSRSLLTQNIGSISNKGLEVSLSVDIVKNKDWKWNVGANMTWLKNKVEKLPEENREKGIISGLHKRVEGGGVYDFWLYQFVGVDQLTGNALYEIDFDRYTIKDTGADGKEVISDRYLTKIGDTHYTSSAKYGKYDWSGSALPKVDGSVATTLVYKNLSLSGLLTYSFGAKVYDVAYRELMKVSSTPNALHKDILNSWDGVPEGMTETSFNRIDPNGVPVIDFARDRYTGATSTRFLKDGSYWAIKNITLNYDFPKSYVKYLKLSSLNLNFGVENVYTYTKLKGMNPQQSFDGRNRHGYLTPRTFLFGINVGF